MAFGQSDFASNSATSKSVSEGQPNVESVRLDDIRLKDASRYDVVMEDPIGYFLTWVTYGTRLPGDSRGWVEEAIGPRQGPCPFPTTVDIHS